MSSNQLPSSPNENRLYTSLITTLEIVQFIGYFIVVVFSLALLSIFSSTLVFVYLIYVVITYIIINRFIAVLIAIIDLLSRIERNTRSE